MKRSKTPNDVDGIKSNNFTIRETLLKNLQCFVVIFISESRNNNVLVANVKISIRCREPHIFINNRRRHGKRYNIDLLSVFETKLMEIFQVLLQRFVVLII